MGKITIDVKINTFGTMKHPIQTYRIRPFIYVPFVCCNHLRLFMTSFASSIASVILISCAESHTNH